LYGYSGCGKSVYFTALKNMFEFNKIGLFSNESSKNFSLENNYNKLVCLAPECDKKFKMARTTYNSIVTGKDPLNVGIKGRPDIHLPVWDAPIVWGGNNLFGEGDTSFNRRTLVFPMKTLVQEGEVNNKLDGKIKEEVPCIVVKCWRLYRQFAEKAGNESLWKHIPQSLCDAQTNLKETTSTLLGFLNSDDVLLAPDFLATVCCSMETFRTAYYKWCESRKFHSAPWTTDLYEQVFAKHGIKIGKRKEQTAKLPTTVKATKIPQSTWLYGVDILKLD